MAPPAVPNDLSPAPSPTASRSKGAALSMSTPTTPAGASSPPPHHPSQQLPVLSINVSATAAASTAEAIRTHAYWSGFYKKTIKERRTQLGLAFPYLRRPTSLDTFASTQTSAKTSGQSTPNFIAGRHFGMTNYAMPAPPPTFSTVSSPDPMASFRLQHIPVPLSLPRSSVTSRRQSLTADSVTAPGSTSPQSPPQVEGSLLNYAEDGSVIASSALSELNIPSQQQEEMDLERRALDLELGQGQEDELMTEEERRDQFDQERKATTISDIETQRKMIGTANGELLQGDLSLDARLDAVLATQQEGAPFPVHGLEEQIANNMIENCIGTMGLPVGLAFNFTINGSSLVVPMAIEEPSVVAAVSSAAKTISTYKGFQAWAPERNMIVAQVQLLDILDSRMDQVVSKLQAQEQVIQEEANEYCTNMVLRGGGVQRVTFHRIKRHVQRESFKGQDLLVKHGVIPARSLPSRTLNGSQGQCSEWLVVHLHIDVGDAMGANCANTVAEGIAPFLARQSGGRVGVRILSNLNVDRIAKSTFRLPFSHMAYKSLSGKDVAVRMLEAFEWADLDPYRAATHNKGIMNGIDAVALATGQDWRAVETGAHAWAGGAGRYSEHSTEATPRQNEYKRQPEEDSSHQQSKIHRGDAYKPLTRYWIEEDEDRLRDGFTGQDALVFCGELEIPIMVGTKGGVLSTNPVHAFTLGVMQYPDSKQLAM
ncbi:hypothetical protein BGZ99_010261, partial [Dissophora globulifera]